MTNNNEYEDFIKKQAKLHGDWEMNPKAGSFSGWERFEQRYKGDDYKFIPVDPYDIKNPRMINPFMEQRTKDMDPSMLPSYLREYLEEDVRTIPRNQFGQPLYSDSCGQCLSHEDTTRSCDLCHRRWVSTRLHSGSSFDSTALYKISESKRVEELQHECPKTQEFLNLLLYAIVS